VHALCKCIISLIFVTHVRTIIARGAEELGGPAGFIEPPESPVSTPLL